MDALYVDARSFRIGEIIYTVTVYQVAEGYAVAWNCTRCRKRIRLNGVATDFTTAVEAGLEAAKKHYAEGHAVTQTANL